MKKRGKISTKSEKTSKSFTKLKGSAKPKILLVKQDSSPFAILVKIQNILLIMSIIILLALFSIRLTGYSISETAQNSISILTLILFFIGLITMTLFFILTIKKNK